MTSKTMPDCKACTDATASPWLCGSYMSGCLGCESREFAKSPQAKDALLGHPQALQADMRGVWPTPELYRAGRLETYRWMELIDNAREKA